MPELRALILTVVVGALVVGGAAPAVAQTADVTPFCNASIEVNSAEAKAERKAAIAKAVAVAPPAIAPKAVELQDLFARKGRKGIESPAGMALVNALDGYVYEHCPGTALPVTAIDYGYEGVPATLAAGLTKIALDNTSPTEDHEMILVKLRPTGERMDPKKLLAMPEKKVGKHVDFSSIEFVYAPAGQTGYAYADLAPGKYIYACFIPVDGKTKGAPHFMEGMYGTVTVS